MTFLEAQALNFGYTPEHQVLHNVSLSVQSQSVVYLLGHNGCGKTTLLEILSGIRAPDSGRVALKGQDVHKLASNIRAQRIGIVPQLHQPVFAYTVRDVVLMGRTPYLRLLSTPSKSDYEVVDEALASVGLSNLKDRSYTDLSGGERQLTLIARGLAQQTELLLLDEPTAHLDPANQHRVLETVSELSQQNITFLISSHNPNSALLYADQVIVMKQGEIVANGHPTTVLTEDVLSTSYEMPIEVIYHNDSARAIMPRRNNNHNNNGHKHVVHNETFTT